MPMLEVKNLRKAFEQKQAVDGISFVAQEGTIFGLVGRNGAGKTTTIRMLMNIYWPDSGEILFNGAPRGADFAGKVSYLPEERGLYKTMSVIDNLMFLAEIRDVPKAVAMERAKRYLERFELADNHNTQIDQLSKGNQQKVQIIGCLLHDPQMIVLDEPFSGLDPVNTEMLKDLIQELRASGKLVIMSTHMMDIAEKLCDHVALVSGGKLVLNASMQDIKRQYSESKVTFEAPGAGGLTFLDGLPFVRGVTRFGDRTTVQVHGDGDIQHLLQALVAHGVPLRKFDANDISLHDIFVQLTRGQPGAVAEDADMEEAA